ncbi:MAG: GAF domain-containing protein, partial [Proteobacteria bacterium]
MDSHFRSSGSHFGGTDLTNCDREKIQYVSAVQGHGAFVAVDPNELRIKHSSNNWNQVLNQPSVPTELIGRRLNEVFSSDAMAAIKPLLTEKSFKERKRLFLEINEGSVLDLHFFRISNDLIGIEVERVEKFVGRAWKSNATPEEQIVTFLSEMKQAKSVSQLADAVCRAVRLLTGMDRVMLYRFYAPEWHGVVIAEDRVAHTHAFLNHRFPATDIPKPARDLYLRNQVRFIYDSEGTNSPILPSVTLDTGQPIDLSESRIRAVSPIHIEYLKNMGVRSSFSVAINVDGALWGLIACHGATPIPVPHRVRTQCEIIANAMAINAPLMELNESLTKQNTSHNEIRRLLTEAQQSNDPVDELFRKHEALCKVFSSMGVAYVSASKVDFAGITPSRSELLELAVALRSNADFRVSGLFESVNFQSSDLGKTHYQGTIAGLLAMKLTGP